MMANLGFLQRWTIITLFVVLSHCSDLHTAGKKLQKRFIVSHGQAEQLNDGEGSRSPEDGEEMVDIETELKSNGDVNLKFSSHGREHLLELTESKKRLADIPIKLVGSSDEFTQEVTSQLKNIRMMRDKKRGASVSFEVVDGEAKPLLKKGIFQLGKYQFEMSTDSHLHKTKVTKQLLESIQTDKYGKISLDVPTRRKRETPVEFTPISVTVELVMLIDYSVWNYMSSGVIIADDAYNHTVNLLLYFAHMNAMINNHYMTLKNDDIHIAVDLAGLVVITSDTEFPTLTEQGKVGKTLGAIATLHRLYRWLNSSEASNAIPPYDHVQLFTKYDLYNEEKEVGGILGMAFGNRICDRLQSSSVVKIGKLLSHDASTAAHELGHSLGAADDGDITSSSISAGCADKNFVMAGGTSNNEMFLANRFLFTCCSQRSFYATVTDIGSCLSIKTAKPNHPLYIDENVSANKPGEVFSADDQCYVLFRTKACVNPVYNKENENICLHLWCVPPSNSSSCNQTNTAAADGTECDVGKWCSQGECVDKGQTYTQPDQNCNVRHCYENERRCDDGVNIAMPDMFQCYLERHACDGVCQCSDGSDELHCTCPNNYYQCSEGRSNSTITDGVPQNCVPGDMVCDGESYDCTDNSDEEALCREKTMNSSTNISGCPLAAMLAWILVEQWI